MGTTTNKRGPTDVSGSFLSPGGTIIAVQWELKQPLCRETFCRDRLCSQCHHWNPKPWLQQWSTCHRKSKLGDSRALSSQRDPTGEEQRRRTTEKCRNKGNTLPHTSCHAGDNLPGLAMPLLEPVGASMCHLTVTMSHYASLIVSNH